MAFVYHINCHKWANCVAHLWNVCWGDGNGWGLFSIVLQCIHNHIKKKIMSHDMTDTIFAHMSHLWSRLRDHIHIFVP